MSKTTAKHTKRQKKTRGEPVALTTPDFLAEQKERLRQLLPQVFTEGKIDVDNARNPMGNYTVWPVVKSLKQVSKSFPFTLTGDQTTHRFIWSRDEVRFRSLQGYRDDDREEIKAWVYSPQEASQHISQEPMPAHINLWMFRGLAPKNGQDVEVIIHEFKFTPE